MGAPGTSAKHMLLLLPLPLLPLLLLLLLLLLLSLLLMLPPTCCSTVLACQAVHSSRAAVPRTH